MNKKLKTMPDEEIKLQILLAINILKARITSEPDSIEEWCSITSQSSRVVSLSRELVKRKYAGTYVKKAGEV